MYMYVYDICDGTREEGIIAVVCYVYEWMLSRRTSSSNHNML